MAKSSILQGRALRSYEPRKRCSSPRGKTSSNIVKQSKTTAGEMLSWPWEYQTQESVKLFILFLWSNEHVVIHCSLLLTSSRRIWEEVISSNLWCSPLNTWDMKRPFKRGWNWAWTSHIAVQGFSCSSVGRGAWSWLLSEAKRSKHFYWVWYFISGTTKNSSKNNCLNKQEKQTSTGLICWDLELWQNGSTCSGWKQMSKCQEGLEIRHFQSN